MTLKKEPGSKDFECCVIVQEIENRFPIQHSVHVTISSFPSTYQTIFAVKSLRELSKDVDEVEVSSARFDIYQLHPFPSLRFSRFTHLLNVI